MPRYKHVSKKAAVRRRRKFESRFTFRVSKSFFHVTMTWAKLGQAMSKAADLITADAIQGLLSSEIRIGIDRAAYNPDSDKTALAFVTKSGDVSTVEGVTTLDQVDRNKTIITADAIQGLLSSEIRDRVTTVSKRLSDQVRSTGLLPRPDDSTVNDAEKALIRKAEMRPYTSTPLTGDEMDSLLELQDRGVVTIITDDFYNIEDVIINVDLDQEGADHE